MMFSQKGFNMQNSDKITTNLKSELLNDARGICHVFCTRHGGISEGLYSSLNCGFGSSDDPANVKLNRARALAQLGVSRSHLLTCNQTHTARAVLVTNPWTIEQAPVADGMVTNRLGVSLAILTADCVPVLFADPAAGVVGAAHVGWRGAIGGVIDATLKLMTGEGASISQIIAAMGPCIAQKSYEVGVEYKDRFVGIDNANERYFYSGKKTGQYYFDLSAFVRHRLESYGISHISQLDCDTCADEDTFFSYRRSLLKGEDNYGRSMSLIALAH